MTSTLAVPGADSRVSFATPAARSAVGIGMFGILVSLLGSWIPSLWGDEAASLMSAERSLPSLATMLTHVDAVHGTYYLGLHFWIQLAGTSPFALRLPSALAIGACIAAVVLLGARLQSLQVGIIAGIVCAVLPRVTSMGDEARSYAFSAAIAAWLTVVFISALRRGSAPGRIWVIYGALLALGIYVFLYVALIALAHGVIVLASPVHRPRLRTWATASAMGVIVASPLVVTALLEHGQIAYLATRSQADFSTVAVSLWFGTPLFAAVAWLLMLTALAFAVRDRLRRNRMSPSLTSLAAAWLLMPTALLVGSHFLIPDFTARYLSMCAPAAALLIAAGIVRLSQGRVAIAAVGVALTVALAVPIFVTQRGPYAKNNSDWAAISAKLATTAHPGDAVAFDESVRPSRRPRLALRSYPAGFSGLSDITLGVPFFQNTSWHDSELTIAQASSLGRLANVSRVWLVEYATPGHTDSWGVLDLRALGFTERARTDLYRSTIVEFTR